jgi:D-alanyl-D-alanine dipeptidase
MNKLYKTFISGVLMTMFLCGCSENTEELPTISITEATEASIQASESATAVNTESTAQIVQTEIIPLEDIDDGDFVRLKDYIPNLVVDLRYATANNFTGERIYDFSEAYLRCGTVKKLVKVQEKLNSMGYGLKIWDAYRPYEAQVRLWEVYPNAVYVANPAKGVAGHNTGLTMDITLVDLNGDEVHMPTEFDSFSTLADRDYSDCDDEAAANAQLLEDVMKEYGFTGYKGEWWDFTDNDSYGGDDDFVPPFDENLTGELPYDYVSKLNVASDAGQLIIVEAAEGETTGELSMHVKDADGVWRELFSTQALVAKYGIGTASEGEMITPKGIYSFTTAFGIKSNPGTRYTYTKVDDSYYWVDDSDSEYYNKFVTTNETGFAWNSAEHIIDNAPMYNYVLALDYNSDCVPMKGSAIFLHVASGDYTAGCIAISEDMMIKVLNNIHKDCKIIIGTSDEIMNY